MKTEKIIAKYKTVLQRCFLFDGCDSDKIAGILKDRGEAAVFSPGETIFSPDNFRRAVGIILQGTAEAQKSGDNRVIVLNHFVPSMMFGAAAVFRNTKNYVGSVVAKSRCRVLFLTGQELEEMFREDYLLVHNYIAFLSQRIAYLNRKIDGFTKSSAQEKVILYLQERALARASDAAVNFSATLAARELGISRASVYRVLDNLVKDGLIAREGNNLRILDAAGLEVL